MTKHNFLQKRARLLNEIRDAHCSLLWFLNADYPQGKRALTLASRRLMERSREMHGLLARKLSE